jgi:hypothetical protein
MNQSGGKRADQLHLALLLETLHENYTLPTVFFIVLLLTIVPFKLLISVVAVVRLYVFSLILFIYSYKNIFKEYYNYRNAIEHTQ